MPALSDEQVVHVLRPFVAATGPVLRGLRDADPFRLGRLARRRVVTMESDDARETAPQTAPQRRRPLPLRVLRGIGRVPGRVLDRLATSKLPGTPRWAVMPPEERDRWWVGRVGRFTSVVASIPGIGGALARRLPVSDIIALSAQGLVLCAIAGEHGMTDRDDQVRMLARIIFDRDVDPSRHGDAHAPEVEREADALAGGVPDSTGGRAGERGRLTALAGAVWRMGKVLWAVRGEIERRPQGHVFWRALANLPFLGAIATYRSERSGLRHAARAAATWVAREQGEAPPRRGNL